MVGDDGGGMVCDDWGEAIGDVYALGKHRGLGGYRVVYTMVIQDVCANYTCMLTSMYTYGMYAPAFMYTPSLFTQA